MAKIKKKKCRCGKEYIRTPDKVDRLIAAVWIIPFAIANYIIFNGPILVVIALVMVEMIAFYILSLAYSLFKGHKLVCSLRVAFNQLIGVLGTFPSP